MTFQVYDSGAQDFMNKNAELEKGKFSIRYIMDQLAASRSLNLSFRVDIIPTKDSLFISGTETIGQILDAIVRTSPSLQYQINENAVVISDAPPKNNTTKYTLYGNVKDFESGESLSYANILIWKEGNDKQLIGSSVSNDFGFYSITVKEGLYSVEYRFLGFQQTDTLIHIDRNSRLDKELIPNFNNLEPVVVMSDDAMRAIVYNPPGVRKIELHTENEVPYFLGEKDVLQKAMLLPGISNVSEDATGVNVRGGNVDQNRILLDNATIYNSSHFYGLVSVFNPDAVKDVILFKSGVHPRYGGRTSSVFVVNQKEGNNKKVQAKGTLGTTFSRFMLEGPIKKLNSSFLLSARGAFPDLEYLDFLSSIPEASFLDINAKWNTTLNTRNRIYLSFYRGRDKAKDIQNADRSWGNLNYTLRWNHVFNKRIFGNFSFISSNYKYNSQSTSGLNITQDQSRIADLELISDFSFFLSPESTFDFGFQSSKHKFIPGRRVLIDSTSQVNEEFSLQNENAIESSVYGNLEFKYKKKLTVRFGGRISNFTKLGEGKVLIYDSLRTKSNDTVIDSLTRNFGKGEIISSFFGLEPRFSANLQLGKSSTLKFSYDRHQQYLHLISNTLTTVPTDIWKMSGPYVRPSQSNNYTLGFYHIPEKFRLESHFEVFFRETSNIVDYKNGAQLFLNENIETELLQGRGRSFGMEFFVKSNISDKLSGWLSYTLSRSLRRYQGRFQEEVINGGLFYPSKNDKLHDISVTWFYKISERLKLSGNFVFSTGRPTTLPSGKFLIDGTFVPSFSDRNQQSLPNYHRLDLGLRWLPDSKKKSVGLKNGTWALSIYNVYSRRNINDYFLSYDEQTKETSIQEYEIFNTIFPSLTYSFKL